MVCTSLGSLLRPLFYFLDDVSYPQSVVKSREEWEWMMTMDGGSHWSGRRRLRVPFCSYNKDAEVKLPPPLCDVTPSWGNFKELVSRTVIPSHSRVGLRDCPDDVFRKRASVRTSHLHPSPTPFILAAKNGNTMVPLSLSRAFLPPPFFLSFIPPHLGQKTAREFCYTIL